MSVPVQSRRSMSGISTPTSEMAPSLEEKKVKRARYFAIDAAYEKVRGRTRRGRAVATQQPEEVVSRNVWGRVGLRGQLRVEAADSPTRPPPAT
jgi:hypothetical protein